MVVVLIFFPTRHYELIHDIAGNGKPVIAGTTPDSTVSASEDHCVRTCGPMCLVFIAASTSLNFIVLLFLSSDGQNSLMFASLQLGDYAAATVTNGKPHVAHLARSPLAPNGGYPLVRGTLGLGSISC